MIGLGAPVQGGITPIGALTRWVLNSDPGQVMGVAYIWGAADLWDDAQVWKD